MSKITAIDLFCGAGGLTHGLLKAGIDVIAGFDIDESCHYAYEKNNKGAIFFKKDIAELTGKELNALFPTGSLRLLAGCAPCQPFSTYSQGRDVQTDKKWPLLYSFSRLIRETMPEFVTMENVPDVVKHDVYHDFVTELENLGYYVWASKIFCPDYGIPQARKRHVLLASRLGKVEIIKPTKKPNQYKTVRDAISKLPPISAGQKHSEDPLHVSASLSEKNLKRIKISKEGGSWNDWPKSLRARCHIKETGRTYSGVYARMRWDEPSPTMTTQCYGFGNGRFGHPEQDRAISLREAAILQTFPKNYRFLKPTDPFSISAIGKMIGNAVPVDLGKIIGKSFLNASTS